MILLNSNEKCFMFSIINNVFCIFVETIFNFEHWLCSMSLSILLHVKCIMSTTNIICFKYACVFLIKYHINETNFSSLLFSQRYIFIKKHFLRLLIHWLIFVFILQTDFMYQKQKMYFPKTQPLKFIYCMNFPFSF